MKTEAWEISNTGARSFTAVGDTLLEVLEALILETEPEKLLADDSMPGGAVVYIAFGDGQYTGVLTVEV